MGKRDGQEKREHLINTMEKVYIGTWNVRTLHATGQLDILLHQLKNVSWSIMGLSEVRWTGAGEFDKGEYKVIYSGRTDDKHRQGVAMILKKEATRALIGYDTVGPRILKARFRTSCGKATVIQVYAPTADSTDEEIDEFYTTLQETMQCTSTQDLTVLMGDLNAKVGDDWRTWKGALGKFGYGKENERGERLLNFCLNHNLTVMNTAFYQRKANRKWTWESPDGKTKNMIDFIMINKRWKSSVSMCRTFSKPDIATDHKLVMAGVRIKLKNIDKEIPVKRFDVEKLKEGAVQQQFNIILKEKWRRKNIEGTSTVEETWEGIRDAYTEVAEEVLGVRKRKKRVPWISQEVLDLSDQRSQMRITKHLSEENRKGYNKLTRDIKKKAKQCKDQWLEDRCIEVERYEKSQNTQKLFQAVNEICGTFSPRLATIKDKNGKILDDKKDIKSRWKQHYEELYNESNPVDSTVLNELPTSNKHECMEDILRGEVETAIDHLKKRKAPGADNITAEMIQAGKECSVDMLHNLCNKIYQEKKCPSDWGKAIIIPIHKKNDKSECGNYRGISLLSVPGKVYTRILQQRLKRYVDEVVAEEQAGFRAGRGTMDQIFTIRQIAEKYFEKNRTLYNNFIDFKQAFDSVWQQGLWQVLRNFGIPEELVVLLEDMYSKTLSAVRVDGELTDWFKITVGVRQGCGLSPDLFNLILEAVMSHAMKSTEAGVTVNGQLLNNLRFADDIDLIADSPDQVQELTNKVNASSKRFGLKINAEKTKTMTIGKQHKELEVTLNGGVLEQVTEFVYLGGLLTEDGQCTKDIKRRIGLASTVFGRLSRMWRTNNVSTKTKTKLYTTLVVPVLLYGAECWTLRKEDERRILVAEMSWLRRIAGRTRRDRIRNEVTREELGQRETLIDKIRKRRLTWFGHVTRMDSERLPARALFCQVKGTRSQGRQTKTWMDNVRQDLKERNMDMRMAMDTIADRGKWRNFVKTSSSAYA